jgi:hypothetical protein
MAQLQTVFKICKGIKDKEDVYYSVSGVGQKAAAQILSKFPYNRIILWGFYVNDNFVKPSFLNN